MFFLCLFRHNSSIFCSPSTYFKETILLYGLCEVQNRVGDLSVVWPMVCAAWQDWHYDAGCMFLVCGGGGWKTEALSICSSVLGAGLPLPCVGSPLLSVWHLQRCSKAWAQAAYRHVGSSRQGITHTLNTHSHRRRGEAESPLGRDIREKAGLAGRTVISW